MPWNCKQDTCPCQFAQFEMLFGLNSTKKECLLLLAIKLDLPHRSVQCCLQWLQPAQPLSILPAALLATKPFVFAFKTETIHVHHCHKRSVLRSSLVSFDPLFGHRKGQLFAQPPLPKTTTRSRIPKLHKGTWINRVLRNKRQPTGDTKGRDPFRCYAYLGFTYTFDENIWKPFHSSDFHWHIMETLHFHPFPQ